MDNILLGSIITALFLFAGTIYKSNSNKKIKQLEIDLEREKLDKKQIVIKYDVVNNLLKFSQYQKIYDAVIRLMEHSSVDRFLVFIAINGKTELNNVTCIFQKFRGDKSTLDAVAVYKNLKVDANYVKLCKKMESDDGLTVHTNDLEPSLIKDIYENEGVKWSRWEFFGRINIDDKNDVIAFGSAATFKDEAFDSQDMLAIKLNVKGVVATEIIKSVKEMQINN